VILIFTSNIELFVQYTPDSSESGELMVHFDTTPLDAPYWVVELGPVVDGKYDYSIVSDSVSAFLFILTRDYERFAAEYEDDVLKSVEKMGFTGFKAPIVSYQGSDCVYESTKRVKHINMMKDVLAMGYKV
jgi:lipocalin